MPKGDKGVRGKEIMQWELSSGRNYSHCAGKKILRRGGLKTEEKGQIISLHSDTGLHVHMLYNK